MNTAPHSLEEEEDRTEKLAKEYDRQRLLLPKISALEVLGTSILLRFDESTVTIAGEEIPVKRLRLIWMRIVKKFPKYAKKFLKSFIDADDIIQIVLLSTLSGNVLAVFLLSCFLITFLPVKIAAVFYSFYQVYKTFKKLEGYANIIKDVLEVFDPEEHEYEIDVFILFCLYKILFCLLLL